MNKQNPYQNLDDRAFWRRAVASHSFFAIADVFRPSFPIYKHHRIATFGSCFAQHIGARLKASQYNWLDADAAPEFVSDELRRRFSYGMFSARTGNIYSAASLRQWIEWSLGLEAPPEEIWQKDGRYFDPFRPTIEPDGFASEEELLRSRQQTFEAMREVVLTADVFMFTLGLTECWVNKQHGYEYAVCPGTVAGEFDAEKHGFINRGFDDIRGDLLKIFEIIRSENPNIRFLLTVSPVPLVATASNNHVLVATMASKSILRAVANDLISQQNLPPMAAGSRRIQIFDLAKIKSLVPVRSLGAGATFRVKGSNFMVPDMLLSPETGILGDELVINHKKDHGFIGARILLSSSVDVPHTGYRVRIRGRNTTLGKFDIYLSNSHKNTKESRLIALGFRPIKWLCKSVEF
ncbi:MAG: hypothetical protein Tsb0019_03030 [Roseibium sp.]